MSPRESYSDRMTCELQGSTAVSEASGAARVFGEAQSLTKDDLARLCIVIEELVANLYEHGGVAHSDRVRLSLSNDSNGIRIVLADPGQPFDPRTAVSSKQQPLRGGGAGVNLVRSWTRFVDYSVQPNMNRLELLMPIQTNEFQSGP
jgi:anti-sigma regulatory factor (Ser/Thr protein kinase)